MTNSFIHLVAGSMGAGKTTYAMDMAKSLDGVRFSIDEWMVNLFAADMPQPLDPVWIWERVGRCEQQIFALAVQVAASGVPVILDLGFQRAEHRMKTAERFREKGFEVRLHWLDAGIEERWRRVNARNDQKGDSYSLVVTKPMFDFMESRWEPPAQDELAALNGSRIMTAPSS